VPGARHTTALVVVAEERAGAALSATLVVVLMDCLSLRTALSAAGDDAGCGLPLPCRPRAACDQQAFAAWKESGKCPRRVVDWAHQSTKESAC
ncbi:hypothetical protein ACLKM7_03555, partial [Microbacterium sp. I2]|uniref:hypothetical protein n=1 Tax=Microbacterium sp. I2 TaxID=3391826 RepID=UPI003EDA1E5C